MGIRLNKTEILETNPNLVTVFIVSTKEIYSVRDFRICYVIRVYQKYVGDCLEIVGK